MCFVLIKVLEVKKYKYIPELSEPTLLFNSMAPINRDLHWTTAATAAFQETCPQTDKPLADVPDTAIQTIHQQW